MFNNSSQFAINGGHFQAINNTNNKLGIMELYRASMPEAAHDSSARKYVPKCYPGTREQHIQDFTLWASNNVGQQQRRFRISWMEGPFGVGKSTIAQTCAGKIGEGLLGAAFFFSRPNQRDDPDRFVPSIAYQISTKVKPLADILDEKICNDPSLLTKTMEIQFRELIVRPFLELKERSEQIHDRVVIVDGLDECRDDYAQCEIIELIAAAVRDHGEDLPFLWAFFSRPEPHIVQTFSSETISPLVWTMSLPVSRKIDKEIELYIRGQFKNVQKRIYHDPSHPKDTWPSESQISALVRKSAGLFIHASTTMKYIGDPEALDPKDRLEEVVSFSRSLPKSVAMSGPSPTGELDSLYTLIMRRIPPHVLPITQQLLILHENPSMPWEKGSTLTDMTTVLGLSVPSAIAALSKLHSVLAIDERSSSPLTFHHASFMEFLTDINRSGSEFCIQQPQHYGSLLKRVLVFLNTSRPDLADSMSVIRKMSKWIELASIDEELALLFARFDFARYSIRMSQHKLGLFYDKIPPRCRDQVIPRYTSKPRTYPQPAKRKLAVMYTLGQGKKSRCYYFDEYSREIVQVGASWELKYVSRNYVPGSFDDEL